MVNLRYGAAVAALAVVGLGLTLSDAHARPASILELDRGLAGGLGYLSSTDSNAGGSQMATILLGDGNTIAQTTSLTGDISAYDAVWVSYNTDSPLTSAEVSNLQAFLASGKKVVLFGDKAGSSYAAYDTALLSVVGGAYTGVAGGAHHGNGNTLASPIDQVLTAGVTDVRLTGVAFMDETAGSPEFLFDGLDVAALFHTEGDGRALVILDSSWMLNNSTYGLYGSVTSGQNDDFAHNISLWLDPPDEEVAITAVAAPEPATIGLLGLGLVGLAGISRRRNRR